MHRDEARHLNAVNCIDKNDNETLEEFNRLKDLWSKYLNVKLADSCKEYDGIKLDDSTRLSSLIVDNSPDHVSGGIQRSSN